MPFPVLTYTGPQVAKAVNYFGIEVFGLDERASQPYITLFATSLPFHGNSGRLHARY
jgi:hypothetical protein